jgi:hypothetical protein
MSALLISAPQNHRARLTYVRLGGFDPAAWRAAKSVTVIERGPETDVSIRDGIPIL